MGWENHDVDLDVTEGETDVAAQNVDMTWAGVQTDDALAEEGNQLGDAIDVDDDLDNGGVPLDATDKDRGVLLPVEESMPDPGGDEKEGAES